MDWIKRADLQAFWLSELERAIRDIGGDPESKAWDRWDIGHIFDAAMLARELKAQYGGIEFRITPAPTQTIYAVTAESSARVFEPTITQGPPPARRHIVVTDLGRGSDHLTATDITTGAPVLGTPALGKRVNKGGRPSVLTPEAEQSALQLMRKGIPKEVVAGRMGVSVSTIKRIARRYRKR